MSRRRAAEKREVLPDATFGSEDLSKFMNYLMQDGNKSVAEGIVYGALELAAAELKANSLEIFKEAVNNVKPLVEVRSKRVGGATYQVPVEVPAARSRALAFKWIVLFSQKRSERTMKEKLAKELVAAYRGTGASIKKREDTHKMADANKAFSHFRV